MFYYLQKKEQREYISFSYILCSLEIRFIFATRWWIMPVILALQEAETRRFKASSAK
jgi:hypothetical protein